MGVGWRWWERERVVGFPGRVVSSVFGREWRKRWWTSGFGDEK